MNFKTSRFGSLWGFEINRQRTGIDTHLSVVLNTQASLECFPSIRISVRSSHDWRLGCGSPFPLSYLAVDCPKSSFVYITPLCQSFRWLLTVLKITSAFLAHRSRPSWSGPVYPSRASAAAPAFHCTDVFLLFHSSTCPLAVPRVWDNRFTQPSSLHFFLTCLILRFWIRCHFRGNLFFPGSRGDAAFCIWMTFYAPRASCYNYIAGSLEQVSQFCTMDTVDVTWYVTLS